MDPAPASPVCSAGKAMQVPASLARRIARSHVIAAQVPARLARRDAVCASKVRDRIVSWHGALRADAGANSRGGRILPRMASRTGLQEYLKGSNAVLASARILSAWKGESGCG
jgi:hypothetical protein